jgi:hypothetical protein
MAARGGRERFSGMIRFLEQIHRAFAPALRAPSAVARLFGFGKIHASRQQRAERLKVIVL